MPVTKISSRLKDWPKEKESVTVEYDLPETLDDLVKAFGADVVASKAVDSIVIDIQANVRRMVRKEGKDAMTVEAIQKKITEYKPTAQSVVRRTPTEKISDLAARMTPEEKAALIARLTAEVTTA